ncbi:MAG TPA: deoxynucleoside kinase [Deltaproteobacteria bacterium]|nr:MAG: hypothetical protein A2048_09060 [Deltaproteobacteria bacterium GWA2_45_12]HBF12464.1 deoxynucleoside kinase [Deltaproteobacteria bacterium]
MAEIRYIAVEGPIGVGKSSLAQMLAKDTNARLILEEAKENPFLGSFYENPDQFAFQAQIYFLLSRYRQQMELKQQDLFKQATVCDYLFAKDALFAAMNLTDEEMDLYNKIYGLLDAQLPKPDLVVFLQASPSVLMNRIKKRRASCERGIQEEYIERLSQAYSQFFFQYTTTPVLVVNASGFDFIESEADYEMLKKEMLNLWKSGKEKHYVTIDSR